MRTIFNTYLTLFTLQHLLYNALPAEGFCCCFRIQHLYCFRSGTFKFRVRSRVYGFRASLGVAKGLGATFVASGYSSGLAGLKVWSLWSLGFNGDLLVWGV